MSDFIFAGRMEREAREAATLAPGAILSAESNGRNHAEPADHLRPAFVRDRDRILHSKAFRRLNHKTQVFMNPEGDHFVTRLTHTLKVAQIGRAIAHNLSLNESLTEAICLGHDVGHSPFGHTGEDALSAFVNGGWLHSEQSVRIFELLEPLNLSREVLDGIRAHSWKVEPGPTSHEGSIVRYADRIAYLSHDAEDGMRAGMLQADDFPPQATAAFGQPGRQWIDSMVTSVVDYSLKTNIIQMEPGRLEAMNQLRDFMFQQVYLHPNMDGQRRRATEIVNDLVDHFQQQPDTIPPTYRDTDDTVLVQVLDYVSGMTDRFAIRTHDRLFRPRLFD